jgi:hypothetical protein
MTKAQLIAFHNLGRATAQYKGLMNKYHLAKIKELTMTTYSVEYTMYFFDEPNVEGYFEVKANSLDEAWATVRRDYPEYAVDDVYERVDN